MRLFFRACVLVAGLVLSGIAGAVGMGGINVSSALGEPLNAEIELAGLANKANIGGTLTARMASPDVFKVAGLDYPNTLPHLTFEIEVHSGGEPYLKITSLSPVNDPFVTLLVELNWSSGRLLREYTFLLDPPGFRPEQPAAVNVKPMAPVMSERSPAISSEAMRIEPAPANVTPPAMSGAASARKSVSSGRTSSGNITVRGGDTLSKIARQVKPADISLERMLVALYRANADEFDGKNMNRLRTGKILRVPSDADTAEVTQAEAISEIHVQTSDWNAYRQKLAAASVTAKETAVSQETTGKISARVAEKTPSAKESSQDVVRLSKGMAPGDKAVAGGSSATTQDKINGMREELTAKNGQLKDSNNRIAMLEKNIKEMQHLLDLKSQTMAAAKQPEIKPEPAAPNAKPKAPAVPPVATTAPPASETPKPEAQPKRSVPAVVPVPPSLLDEILNEPLNLAGIAAIVLLLLGGGFMVMRRNRTRNKSWGTVEHNIAEPAPAAAAVGEATQPHPVTENAPPPEEEVDPISEADLFLNFGRDTQAEEILKYALEKDPSNQRILLKLLSIYHDRKDAKTFYAIAQQVREFGDSAAWARAAEMGRKLEPENPAYGGEAGSGMAAKAVAPEPEQVRQEPGSIGLDFDLDFEKDESATGANTVLELDKPAASDSTALDFDLGTDITAFGGAAPARADDKTGKFSATGDQAGQLGTDHGFVDITSKSFPLQGAAVVEVGGATEPHSEEFIDVTSSSFPLQAMEAVKPVVADTAESASEDFIDVSSKSFPLQGIDVAKPVAGVKVPAAEDFIDVSSKSFPLHGIELDIPSAGGKQAPAAEDFIDVTSRSMPLPEPGIEVGNLQAGAVSATAAPEFIDITSGSLPIRQVPHADIPTAGATVPEQIESLNFDGIDLNLGQPAEAADTDGKDAHWTEVTVKIDLAKAYQEIGDAAGAHEILKEVMDEGDDQQRATAKAMLEKLSA